MHIQTAKAASNGADSWDLSRYAADFPILAQQVRGKPLVYLDNAATTQKPAAVIRTVSEFYEQHNSNVHRGVHLLSQRATQLYEDSREKVRAFLNAASTKEIVFTRGTTEAINLVASAWGRETLKPGDEVLISWMEHHSNIVPWQMVCQQTGATLKVIPINDAGELDLKAFESLLSTRTKMLAITAVSNALGTVNPLPTLIEKAHGVGALVLVDGAQLIPHAAVDVQALDCDFLAFSSHKLYGPTGVGVLYGKEAGLHAMAPYQGGGDMIRTVSFERTTYAALPNKFEAGTPNIAGAIGLGAAIDYVSGIGMNAIAQHEAAILEYGTAQLLAVPGLRMIGTAKRKAGVLSFVLEGVHPHDIGTIVDMHGVAIRTGHHCAQPVMDRFRIPATARASLALYSSRADIDALVRALSKVKEVFG
ncbi:MAG: cysteine desulfurase CsdA [Deltaproteobacteria bacterium CG_4_9_14_3_um_filter_63_12]|nr:MAG: cysteine desulfurase CsdA [Deltaproteobacteria bacterium CG_4_9_14_3_um_filter_63_12]